MHIDTADAPALSRLAAMRAGKRYLEPDSFEAKGVKCEFNWRVLMRSEKQECLAGAIARFEELRIPHELRGYEDLEAETLVQVLAMAMRDPEDAERPLAKDAAELRETLTVDELDALWNRYADFEDRVNPDLDATPYFDAIEEAIKKKDERALMSFGSRLLASYVITTGSQPSS